MKDTVESDVPEVPSEIDSAVPLLFPEQDRVPEKLDSVLFARSAAV